MQTSTFSNRFFRTLRYFHAFFGVIISVLIVFILTSFLFSFERVDGNSMNPTLSDGQIIGVCLVCTDFSNPHVGDIVVIQYAGGQGIHLVKRVLGTPEEAVTYDGLHIALGADQYFVVGDNRDQSTDSRSFGPVDRSQIIGFVIGNYGPGPGSL